MERNVDPHDNRRETVGSLTRRCRVRPLAQVTPSAPTVQKVGLRTDGR